MHKLVAMFKLEPMVKLNDLWRVAYRNGYDKPRILKRMSMYEMLWFVVWATFTFLTIKGDLAYFGMAMLIAWLWWFYYGPIVSIIDTDSGRIRRLSRKDYRQYRLQFRGKVAFPTYEEVGISPEEKIPNRKN
ncbi:hypothetical protein EQG49_09945 [Periweissella cryptocerci]|uniref:Uncharacterized protein n=1 Tax=Periweissella cryptocerci TaxID=2506420 RepID=A0A4P6YVE2_9LACO|nr:hypothetical protein [Periweissella cryptocerci]QBO36758.1 hypothetical protein EQG49_09945 [Periweissella cryptocerci]